MLPVGPSTGEARPGDVARVGYVGRVALRHEADGGEIVTAAHVSRVAEIPIYPAYPPGDYTLRALPGVFPLRITHTQPTPSNPPDSLRADFGPLTLLGYEPATLRAAAGGQLDLTLYWRADDVTAVNYTVFAHLLGPFRADGPVWAGDDSYPAQTPTSALWPGLTFSDARTLRVPPDMPPGMTEIEIGLYDLETGERLPLPDGSDRVLISGVEITQ